MHTNLLTWFGPHAEAKFQPAIMHRRGSSVLKLRAILEPCTANSLVVKQSEGQILLPSLSILLEDAQL